jgi:predicted site-specific integrase-resolvase
LERQVNLLKEKYPEHIIFKEVASGINFKRKIFQRILDDVVNGSVKEVVVAHKDRLCRFAYEHFVWLFNKFDTSIVVDSEDNKHTPESELAEDLISIVHVFSSRHYGQRRKYTKRGVEKNIDEDKDASTECSEIEDNQIQRRTEGF